MDNRNPNARPLGQLPSELDLQPIAAATDAPLPPDRDIDISYFSHKSRKSTRLIGAADEDDAMRGRREWLSFDLNEPIYLTSIKVFATGYDEHHEMELSVVDALSGDEVKEKRSFGGQGFSFEPKRFATGFGLRPDSTFFKSSYLTKIEVRGIELAHFSDVINIYENIQRERIKIEEGLKAYLDRARAANADYESKEGLVAELDEKIEASESQVESLNEQLDDLNKQRNDLLKKIEISSSVERERSERVQSIEIDINNLNDNRKSLSAEISKSEAELRELKNNINLFPTEIAGYVSQGTINIRLYFWLSFIPVAIIGFVTYRLFANSERLLSFDITDGNTSIITYLLSRSPYVIVSATVLGICYSLVRGLVAEIVNINRRRQEIYKISIIATDVSYASQDDLELDDEQRYDLRTQTKMELLKEHLKMNLGDDFSYSPKLEYLRKLGSAMRKQTSRKSDKIEEETDAEESAESRK